MCLHSIPTSKQLEVFSEYGGEILGNAVASAILLIPGALSLYKTYFCKNASLCNKPTLITGCVGEAEVDPPS